MSIALLWLALAVLGTSFLSGVFGMAGGMILMGLLLLVLPVPAAMVLHGVAQMASNGWRAILWRRKTDWRIVLRYVAGLLCASLLFAFVRFVPPRELVLVCLGLIPFLVVLTPEKFVPQAEHRWGAEMCGFVNTAIQFVAGVSGPMLDAFFVRSRSDRRTIVATKASCQTVAHFAKLIYFLSITGATQSGGPQSGGSQAALDEWAMAVAVIMAIAGTTLSKLMLDRMSDVQFRRWTRLLIMSIGGVYLVQGGYAYWALL